MKSIVFFLILLVSYSVYGRTTPPIPPQAFDHKETIENEIINHFPNIPTKNYVPALIEHESCLSLTHSRCWRPTSRRYLPGKEEGVGLGQITRTWRQDGTIRFDSLTAMRNQYRRELHELTWGNVQERPDLQIRLIVLMIRDEFRAFSDIQDPMVRLQFSNAAYNGGRNLIKRERQVCHLSQGCDASKWFGNAENHCIRSTLPRGNERSPCEINRHHTRDVFTFRLPRYEAMYFITPPDPIEDDPIELVHEVAPSEPEPSLPPDPKVVNNERRFCLLSWCFPSRRA
jgi:hypothetical protein